MAKEKKLLNENIEKLKQGVRAGFFDCGLSGTALSYLDIFRKEGLSEKGKDRFIGALLGELQKKIECIPKKQYDDAIELIHAMRDELYEKLPTGDVQAFDLIKLIKEHIKNIDDAFPTEEKCQK